MIRVTVALMKYNVHMLPELIKLTAKYGATWLDCHEAIVFDARKLNSPLALSIREDLIHHFRRLRKHVIKLRVRVTYGRKPKTTSKRKIRDKPKHKRGLQFIHSRSASDGDIIHNVKTMAQISNKENVQGYLILLHSSCVKTSVKS